MEDLNPTYNGELVAIHCENEADALGALRLAHELGLKASYHPLGGDNGVRFVPITHTVYVTGENDYGILRVQMQYEMEPKEDPQ